MWHCMDEEQGAAGGGFTLLSTRAPVMHTKTSWKLGYIESWQV